MNTTIAQHVALVCYGNGSLRGMRTSRFFPDNSTCKFCERVSFVEIERSLFGGLRERMVAATPDDWFRYLANKQARGLRLRYGPRILRDAQGQPLEAFDRLTASFIDGGGEWRIAARLPHATDYWASRWELGNREAPDKRIWRVAYGRIKSQPDSAEPDAMRQPPAAVGAASETEAASAALRTALVDILSFARAHEPECQNFIDCFAEALATLDRRRPALTHHQDLYVAGVMSEPAAALLEAAQSTWVFGGMGSWNDIGFFGEAANEYNRVSDALFTAMTTAICAAANTSG